MIYQFVSVKQERGKEILASMSFTVQSQHPIHGIDQCGSIDQTRKEDFLLSFLKVWFVVKKITLKSKSFTASNSFNEIKTVPILFYC